MAQSLNSTVELTTTGVSYLGMGGKDQGNSFSVIKVLNFIATLTSRIISKFLGKTSKKSALTFLVTKSAVTLKSLQIKENFFLPQKTQEKS